MPERQSEAELIERAVGGDSSAAWQLLCLYRPRLLVWLNRNFPRELRDDLEPNDILQDLYFQVFRRIGQFRPDGQDQALWRWMVTIARRLLSDAMRRQQAAKRGRRTAPDEIDQSLTSMLDELATYQRTPSRSAMAHELMANLQRSLAALPEEYRMALHLRHFEGLDVASAAARMNRTTGAFQMLCVRALKALRIQMRSQSL